MKNPRIPQMVVEVAARMAKLIRFTFLTHAESATQLRKATRLWDHHTPYAVHPCWCAMCILQETTLPEEIRWNGYQALLLHDVLEDTTASLPDDISPEVRQLVDGMTFDSIDVEREQVWSRGKEIILLKLYDKTSNLLEGRTMYPDRRVLYLAYIRKLIIEVRKEYGELNIVTIAEAMCDRYQRSKRGAVERWIYETNDAFQTVDQQLNNLSEHPDENVRKQGFDLGFAILKVRHYLTSIYREEVGIDEPTFNEALEEVTPTL